MADPPQKQPPSKRDPDPPRSKEDASARPDWVDADPFLGRAGSADEPRGVGEVESVGSAGARPQGESSTPPEHGAIPPKADEPAVEQTRSAKGGKHQGSTVDQAQQAKESLSGEVVSSSKEPRSQRRSSGPSEKVAVDPSLVGSGGQPTKDSKGAGDRPPRPPAVNEGGGKGGAGRGRRRGLLLPLWVWVLGLLVAVTVALLFLDLRNRDSFRLQCDSGKLSVRQARRFPWPFGFDTLGGNLRPIVAAPESDCTTQRFRSRESAESAFIDFVLEQVRRAIATPSPTTNLKQLHLQLHQARRLALDPLHQGRRKAIKRLLADLSYREGRARLARVEMTLRESLALLQQAKKLGGGRYDDLEAWIIHLETVIKSVAPSPRATTQALPLPALPTLKGSLPPKARSPISGEKKTNGAPKALVPTVDGGIGPDAAAESSGGILM